MEEIETKSFIQNHDLLREDSKVDDLLDFSSYKEQLKSKFSKVQKSCLIGLVGGFGKGKSTLLYQIQKDTEETYRWINFDAWKFPERKELWEGFVLEFANQISEKELNKAKKKVDGASNSATKSLVKLLSEIPYMNFLNCFSDFFDQSPAKRVFEIQKVLTDIINTIDQDIYIVIEDIDRSGDAGIFFLETFNQFLRDLELKNKIIVIVPIATENYEKNVHSYIKCLNFIEFFNPPPPKLTAFIETIFDQGEEFIGNQLYKSQIVSFLERLFVEFPETTIRLLKLILRKADINHQNMQKDGHEPDWRTVIAFETSKYFFIKTANRDIKLSFYQHIFKEKLVKKDSLFAAFFEALASENGSLPVRYREQNIIEYPRFDFKIIERVSKKGYPSHPYHTKELRFFGHEGDDRDVVYACVCDFYLKY